MTDQSDQEPFGHSTDEVSDKSPEHCCNEDVSVSECPGCQYEIEQGLWDGEHPEDCECDDCYEDHYLDPSHFGESGNAYNPSWHPKWMADGQTDLMAVADIYAWLAEDIRAKAQNGWRLSQPVDNGYIMTEWAGEGSPPSEDSDYVNGENASGERWKTEDSDTMGQT